MERALHKTARETGSEVDRKELIFDGHHPGEPYLLQKMDYWELTELIDSVQSIEMKINLKTFRDRKFNICSDKVTSPERASDRLLALKGRELGVWKDDSNYICIAYKNCEVKDGEFLIYEPGHEMTFEEACTNYLQNSQEKHLCSMPVLHPVKK